MNGRKNGREQSRGAASTRREFNARLAKLLTIIACAPLPLRSWSSPDRGRWILNERDR